MKQAFDGLDFPIGGQELSGVKITNDFIAELKTMGLRSGTKSWHDYEQGKKFIQDNKPMNEYNAYISILTAFLEV